jgi:uncharacterized membrane protein
MTKVLYAGDAAAVLGPIFIASPFNTEVKGFARHVWGQPLIDALQGAGIEVVHMANEVAISEFPRTVEGLQEYDVIILSDIEQEILSLYQFWIPGTAQPTANRLKAIREFTRQGGGLLMVGGWSSFSGRYGTAAYYDTPVEEALPVNCLPGIDDRLETPEGAYVNVHVDSHPVIDNIPWDDSPPFAGFNKIIPKEGSQVLATIGQGEDENPFIIVWQFGEGRSMAFASDCSPHWATYFQPWEYYGPFWVQTVRWLAKEA